LVGATVVAIPSTVATYFIGRWFFQARRDRRAARDAARKAENS
jgi:uncharacterized protein (DUF2062 family)